MGHYRWLCVFVGLTLTACGGDDNVSTSQSMTTPTPTLVVGPPTLREAGQTAGRMVGAALTIGPLAQEAQYREVAAREFDYVTAEWEMKWDPIQRTRGVFDFARGDQIVDFALARGMKVKGHALIWHSTTPQWVEQLSPAELWIEVENHIRTVMEHYRSKVIAWDVVNEAIADDGRGLRNSVFRQKLGDDYVAQAFHIAHEADPDALLIYNDYSGEGLGAKSDAIYELVRSLKQRNVPIHGVGLQMHISAASYPATADIAANMRRLANLDLLVNISEMDVRIQSAGLDHELQRSVYHDVVAVCVAEPQCHAVTFWGFTDKYSWIDDRYGPDDPLLFDEQYNHKPAYLGVRDALQGE